MKAGSTHKKTVSTDRGKFSCDNPMPPGEAGAKGPGRETNVSGSGTNVSHSLSGASPNLHHGRSARGGGGY